MQDVLAKLKEIVGTYDNEDMQAAIAASQVTQTEETIEEAHMMPKTLKCKECGDMLGNPTTDCPCDSQDPKGDNWIMVDVDNDGDMDMAVANEEEVEETVEEETIDEAVNEKKFAYDQGVNDAKKGKEKTNASDVYGPHADEYYKGYDSVKKAAKESLEGILRLSGQSGVMGMNTNVIVAESVEVVEDEVSEEAFIAKEADEEKTATESVEEANESVETEAVGTAADLIMDLCDDLGCDPDHPIFAELVRYLSGDQIEDFVADFRRHNDMNHPGEDGDYGDDDANFGESVEEATVEVPVQELAELMKLAGYENYADQIEEYANEPAEEYSDVEDQMIGLSGGLNGPKKAYAAAAGGDNPMDQEPTDIEEDDKLTFEGMYKRYMTQVAEETLQEKE